MWWLSSKSEESSSDRLSFLTPELKEYYDRVKPNLNGENENENVTQDATKESGAIPVDNARLFQPSLLEEETNGKLLTLKQAAMDNCVELEIELSNCLRNGPMMSRLTSCYSQTVKLDRCHKVQADILNMFGYLKSKSAEERSRIQGKADDLFIKYAPDGSLTSANEALLRKEAQFGINS